MPGMTLSELERATGSAEGGLTELLMAAAREGVPVGHSITFRTPTERLRAERTLRGFEWFIEPIITITAAAVSEILLRDDVDECC